jgi:hypothetical protein
MILATFFFTLNSSRTLLHLNLEHLRDNYNLWGPSARICISLISPKRLEAHEAAVIAAAHQFTVGIHSGQFTNIDAVLVTHRLFTVQPTKDSRQKVTANFATNHLLGFVSRAGPTPSRRLLCGSVFTTL